MNDINFHDYFYYDPTSPSGLRWKQNVGKCYKARDTAGSLNKDNGRYDVRIHNTSYTVSRVIYSLFNPGFSVPIIDSNQFIDHIDGNPVNNCIENLRVVDCTLNNRNVKKSTKNKSGKVGVHVEVKNDKSKRLEPRMAVAYVSALDGTRIRKRFSFSKYGEEEALRLAHEFRDKQLALLNEQGAGYTERHGT